MAFRESLDVHTEGHVFAGFWRSELKGHVRLLKTRPLESFEGFPFAQMSSLIQRWVVTFEGRRS